MTVKQAKDFLVRQTSEQAALDGVPLSDLEKGMMYCSESDDSCERPTEPNEEFQANCTPEYEIKISRLLHHAFERIKSKDRERMRDWNLATRTLRRGDHLLWSSGTPSLVANTLSAAFSNF